MATISGNQGNVTWSGGTGTSEYAASLNTWTVTITQDVEDVTVFNATPPEWKDFAASGIKEWSGTCEGFLDSETGIPSDVLTPFDVTTLATLTLQVKSGYTFNGTAISESIQITKDIQGRDKVSITFRGSSTMTVTGP